MTNSIINAINQGISNILCSRKESDTLLEECQIKMKEDLAISYAYVVFLLLKNAVASSSPEQ